MHGVFRHRYALVSSIGVAAAACRPAPAVEPVPPAPLPTHTARLADDDSWVAVSGTVVETSDDWFVMDYGLGRITVEMDDSDWYPEARALLENDRVVVHGFVDDGFYERRTIEASSVYARSLGTHFYASGVDEEDFPTEPVIRETPYVELSGAVKDVSEQGFELETSAGGVEVGTAQMPHDPRQGNGNRCSPDPTGCSDSTATASSNAGTRAGASPIRPPAACRFSDLEPIGPNHRTGAGREAPASVDCARG